MTFPIYNDIHCDTVNRKFFRPRIPSLATMDRQAKNCQFYFSSVLQWLQTVADLGKEE